jgi:hypothetical protein
MEAILWRQLAYCQQEQQRRQVFISSHHEDMTNHLLDLLVPPKGYKMRLLRFIDWSSTKGPEIESFEIEETRSASNSARQSFVQDLEHLTW